MAEQQTLTWQVCSWCSNRLGETTFSQPPGRVKWMDTVPGVFTGKCPHCDTRQTEAVFVYSPEVQEQAAHVKEEEKKLLASMKITSGFNFEGYAIVEYYDYVIEEAGFGLGLIKAIAANVSDLFGAESESLRKKLAQARDLVMYRVRDKASRLGANAIIGMDLDYTMFGESLLGVIASGTAVKIVPNEEVTP